MVSFVDVVVAIALVVAFALLIWALYMVLVYPVSKVVQFWKDWRFTRRFEARRRTDPDFAARFRPPHA